MELTYADASTASGKATSDSETVEARFVDIVPGVRVVQAVTFVADDPAYAGTRVNIRADQVPSGIPHRHAVGLASSLANRAAHIERQDPPQMA